jgi:hypothetical protein
MRVLLTFHRTLDQTPASERLRSLATRLREINHDVRLIVAAGPSAESMLSTRAVSLDQGLTADPPGYFSGDGATLFEQLTDSELSSYRQAFRAAMDDEINHWNPNIIHTQHAGIHAQLALETGVPFVCTAWGAELDLADRDPRYYRLVEQAVENAGRILISSEEIGRRLQAICEGIDDRLVFADSQALSPTALSAIYQSVLDERFGRT